MGKNSNKVKSALKINFVEARKTKTLVNFLTMENERKQRISERNKLDCKDLIYNITKSSGNIDFVKEYKIFQTDSNQGMKSDYYLYGKKRKLKKQLKATKIHTLIKETIIVRG